MRRLLIDMRPEMNPGRYVFTTVAGDIPPGVTQVVTMAEREGLTLVLRPGGRPVIADTVERPPVDPGGRAVLDEICASYHVSAYATADEYSGLPAANGFVDIDLRDISDKVVRTGVIMADVVEARRDELARIDGPEPIDQYIDLMRRATASPGIRYLVIAATLDPRLASDPVRRAPAARPPSVTRGTGHSGCRPRHPGPGGGGHSRMPHGPGSPLPGPCVRSAALACVSSGRTTDRRQCPGPGRALVTGSRTRRRACPPPPPRPDSASSRGASRRGR